MERTHYTLPEIAHMTGLGKSSVWRAVQNGRLRATRPGGMDRLVVAVGDFEEWVNGSTVSADVIPMRRRA